MNKYLLLVIVLVAAFLRFWQIGTLPPSLTWDEAAWGYNAYTLGIDAKDEFGRLFPYDYLESFGDFKPPVYAYLAVPAIKFFGLTEFATRFPSAFFGTFTVLLTFFLTREIFYQAKLRDRYALLATGLLAVSPWHINLSRAAFEANVASFFIVSAIVFFLLAVRKNMKFLIVSAVFFVLSFYTFNTARIVSPMLVVLLVVGFWRKLFLQKSIVLIAAIVGFLLVLPSVPFLLSPQASLRYKEVNIFSDISIITRTNQQIENDNNAPWSKIIHNRRLAYSVEYLRHYLDNLHPNFLFIKGDGNPKFSTQDVGQLYFIELPFLFIGSLLLFKRREGYWWIIPLWLLLGIVPAGTARETPHALRIETTLPTFQLLVAYGVIQIIEELHGMKRTAFYCLSSLCLVLNIVYYLHGYYNHYAREFSGEWQYGYKEAITFINKEEARYKTVYMTEELGRPYIYLLFYKKYDPMSFRKTAIVERNVFGFVNVKGFDKYRFGKTLNKDTIEKTLYINTPSQVPPGAKVLKTFYMLNAVPALVAYEV